MEQTPFKSKKVKIMKLLKDGKDVTASEALLRIIVAIIMTIPIVIAILLASIPCTRYIGDKMMTYLSHCAMTFNNILK